MINFRCKIRFSSASFIREKFRVQTFIHTENALDFYDKNWPQFDEVERLIRTWNRRGVKLEPSIDKNPVKKYFRPNESGWLLWAISDTDRSLTDVKDAQIVKFSSPTGTPQIKEIHHLYRISKGVYVFPWTAPSETGKYTTKIRFTVEHESIYHYSDVFVTDKIEASKPDSDGDTLLTGTIRHLDGKPASSCRVELTVLADFYDQPMSKYDIITFTDKNGNFETSVPQGGKVKVIVPDAEYRRFIPTNEPHKDINEFESSLVGKED